MPIDEDNSEGGLPSLVTDGEDDPYGGPTRVAPVPDELLGDLMRGDARPSAPGPQRSAAAPARKDPAPAQARKDPAAAPARKDPAPAREGQSEPSRRDAGANDLSALAAAASHVVVPQRPKGPPPPPVAERAAPLSRLGMPEAAPAIAPAAPAAFATPAASATSPGPVPPAPVAADPPIQSGRTVPLSAALLASVVKSVDDRRAAARPAEAGTPATVPAPARTSRFALVLACILIASLAVFITGVVMFLDANQ